MYVSRFHFKDTSLGFRQAENCKYRGEAASYAERPPEGFLGFADVPHTKVHICMCHSTFCNALASVSEIGLLELEVRARLPKNSSFYLHMYVSCIALWEGSGRAYRKSVCTHTPW